MKIAYLNLKAQQQTLKPQLLKAIEEVIDSGWYILGPALSKFEQEFAAFSNVKYCSGVANGLDALTISLKALDVSAGDEVIVPSNTYIASWLAVSNLGAVPVPVEPRITTYNLNPDLIEAHITPKTKAIMPVHLYGQACEMESIMGVALKNKIPVVEDNAQAQGAMYKEQYTGSFGKVNATSFYPAKNAGALGDAGAITSNDEAIHRNINILRNYGSEVKYYNETRGYNSRLDELQAAVLSVKLPLLKQQNLQRNEIAKKYAERLKGIGDLILPATAQYATHVYHIFCIRTARRDALKLHLTNNGIETLIHYPLPPHLQKAYNDLGYHQGAFPLSELIAKTCLSLPLYPGLGIDEIDYICDTIKKFFS